MKENLRAVFDLSACFIQDQKIRKVLARGEALGNLYVLKQVLPNNDVCNVVSSRHSVSHLWHRRMGHAPLNILKHASLPVIDSHDACVVGHKAKEQRLAFPVSSNVSSDIFELIHVDVWGPYNKKSISNTRLILTVVDDFSKATWTFMLKDKTRVVSFVVDFVHMVENQFGKRVKTIRSDNGTKFINDKFIKFFLQRQVFYIIDLVLTHHNKMVL